MKFLIFICMIFFTAFSAADEIPPPPPLITLEGEVLEAKDVSIYTYVHLKTGMGETWAAVGRSRLAKGDHVAIEKAMLLHDFKSPSLKKTFKTIYFGNLAEVRKGAALTGPPSFSAGSAIAP